MRLGAWVKAGDLPTCAAPETSIRNPTPPAPTFDRCFSKLYEPGSVPISLRPSVGRLRVCVPRSARVLPPGIDFGSHASVMDATERHRNLDKKSYRIGRILI